MSKFQKSPQHEAFIRGADKGTSNQERAERKIKAAPPEAEQPIQVADALRVTGDKKPWEGLDPKATPRINFSLRLNEYQHQVLKYLADQNELLSMQKLAKMTLFPALEKELAKLEGVSS